MPKEGKLFSVSLGITKIFTERRRSNMKSTFSVEKKNQEVLINKSASSFLNK